MAQWSLGVSKLKGCRRQIRKDQYPVSGEAEHTMCVILICVKISNWRVEVVCEKWRSLHEKTVLKGTINCGSGNCLKSLSMSDYLFRFIDKWDRCVQLLDVLFVHNYDNAGE
jgi:hypothetical protein